MLIEKDEQAHRDIGDPSVFMNQYDVNDEEKLTRDAIADGESAEDFDSRLTPETSEGDELMALFLGTVSANTGDTDDLGALGQSSRPDQDGQHDDSAPESLFASDLAYVDAALAPRADRESQTLTLDAPADLQARFRQAPSEIRPKDWRFVLTADRSTMEAHIAESRRQESDWPQVHYLWRLNPVVEWLNDRMLATFGRHEAPVLAGVPGLLQGEAVFVVTGQVANRKGQPLVTEWIAIPSWGSDATDVEPFEEFADRIGLGSTPIANVGAEVDVEQLTAVLPEVVELGRMWVGDEARRFQTRMEAERDCELDALAALQDRRRKQIEARRERSHQLQIAGIANWRADAELDEVEEAFSDYCGWVEDTMTIAGAPQVSVVAVLTGRDDPA